MCGALCVGGECHFGPVICDICCGFVFATAECWRSLFVCANVYSRTLILDRSFCMFNMYNYVYVQQITHTRNIIRGSLVGALLSTTMPSKIHG